MTGLNHSRIIRVNPKGELPGIFKCVDCGDEGRWSDFLGTECTVFEKTSQERALLDSLEDER